jgi:hypothetical protein
MLRKQSFLLSLEDNCLKEKEIHNESNYFLLILCLQNCELSSTYKKVKNSNTQCDKKFNEYYPDLPLVKTYQFIYL